MSTGAAAGVIGDMRRQQRREEARRQRARAKRLARRDAVRHLRDFETAPSLATHRWPFPCASLCGNCGALALPTTSDDGDPMRNDRQLAPATRCIRCDASRETLIDLANRDMARVLVDAEIHDRKVHAERVRVIGGPLASTLILASLATAAVLTGAPILVGAVLGTATMLRGATAARRWSARGTTPTHARRWAYHPAARAPASAHEGHATGSVRRSPLSGQACIAYDVRVVWGGEDPTAVRSLALHEQHTRRLFVDRIDASRAHLEVIPRKLSTQEVLGSPEALRYLATRGLDPTDGAFDYYETVLVDRQAVRLEEDTDGRQSVRMR